MQLDRMMIRQAARLAPKLLAQATQRFGGSRSEDRAEDKPLKPADPELRGSGSWANEWAGAKTAIARTRERSRLLPGGKPDPEPVDVIAEDTISIRPLLTAREVKLFNWIADRVETAAPTVSLHAGVALSAFLHSEVPGALDGLVADMALVDETGAVLGVLIRDRKDDPARQIRLIDALIDSDMPTIDLPNRLSLSRLWEQITDVLPNEA